MIQLNYLIAALMLALLAALSAVPHVHAHGGLSAIARGHSGQPNTRVLHSQDDLQLQAGTIVEGVVVGEASAGEQSLLATGVARSRSLLHGSRSPKDYPLCNQCRTLNCTKRGCTGHCRKHNKLFNCRSKTPPPEPKRYSKHPANIK